MHCTASWCNSSNERTPGLPDSDAFFCFWGEVECDAHDALVQKMSSQAPANVSLRKSNWQGFGRHKSSHLSMSWRCSAPSFLFGREFMIILSKHASKSKFLGQMRIKNNWFGKVSESYTVIHCSAWRSIGVTRITWVEGPGHRVWGGLKWYDMIQYDRNSIGPEKSQESRPQQLDLNIAMAAMGIQQLWHDTMFTTGMTQWKILTVLMIITLHCSTWPISSHPSFTSVICHRTRCHC